MKPMVETIYHAHNKSVDEYGVEQEDPLWIVEPNQDGGIYVYDLGSGMGIQKLPFTVKELVDRSPLSGVGPRAIAYTAEKRTTLYTIDATTGNVLRRFSAVGLVADDGQSCKNVNSLEDYEQTGRLTLGRTEYTIGVQDGNTGEQISTIRFSEWVPNNHDHDLRSQHETAMDSRYVYTKHDGTIFGLDVISSQDFKRNYRRKLSSPVARVFDVVRQQGDVSGDASLVVLPQPAGPSLASREHVEDDILERVFVNCTEDGSWYALSESNYPTVTDGAARALKVAFDVTDMPMANWPRLSKSQRQEFVGVHQLNPICFSPGGNLIDGAPHLGIDPPPPEVSSKSIYDKISTAEPMVPLRSVLVAVVLLVVACGVLWQRFLPSGSSMTDRPMIDLFKIPSELDSSLDKEGTVVPMVREAEPARETIFPVEPEEGRESPGNEVEQGDDDLEKAETNEIEGGDDTKDADDGKPSKKKATRGKRGGKKQKEKEQQRGVKRAESQPPAGPAVVSVPYSESVSGPLQINSLVIHTDKIIGQGSCGTCVFEGSFEGRDVAVKRMLSQYYELASQEVAFLQQSDDHPNVVRYFCQQRDDHFLYIAVELCQASVFEVWEAEKAKTEERQIQLRTLRHAIQQDVPRALHQLAAGLYHLHNLRIIHRDIKPQNILVAYPKRNQDRGPRLVISDFGLGKNLPENVSTLIDPTGNAGTSGWKAPELISQPRDSESKHSQSTSHTGGSEQANGTTSGVKRAADIFSLGCLFFWVLTDGSHPYEDENGWQQLRELNIKRDNKKMEILERWSDAYEPMQLITSMLEHLPENRPTALQVLNHPFFWSAEKRLSFLCDCSDHYEREQRGVIDDGYQGDSWDLHLLECKVEEIVGVPCARADFLSKLDRHFVDTLGKQRKYSGNRVLDLLRALRNKKNHYEDMPEDVKKRVGPLAGGYLNYWTARFPRLLMACYEAVHEAGLQGNDRFKGYFALEKV